MSKEPSDEISPAPAPAPPAPSSADPPQRPAESPASATAARRPGAPPANYDPPPPYAVAGGSPPPPELDYLTGEQADLPEVRAFCMFQAMVLGTVFGPFALLFRLCPGFSGAKGVMMRPFAVGVFYGCVTQAVIIAMVIFATRVRR